MRAEVTDDAAGAAARAATAIAAAARAAVERHGAFALALSGGRTPWAMCAALAGEDVPWHAVRIFQVDERVAPDGDPARNLTQLLRHLPPPARARLEPLAVTGPDLDAVAAAYAARLPAALDLVHLGLGADGHTASLVPGDPVLDERERLVAPTARPYQGHRRLTLTYPCLAAARSILWLVTGAEKRAALARLRAGDRSIPAGRVEARDALLVADRAAHARRGSGRR